jgi:hypothetical protein
MAKIIQYTGITRLDLPPDQILERAKDQLTDVVIIGYDKDGNDFFASSLADGGTVLWLLEKCKKALLSVEDE